MAQAQHIWQFSVTHASMVIGNFVQRFYQLPFASTDKSTVEPSEVGLSDQFMIEGNKAGQSVRPPLYITMVLSRCFGYNNRFG
jgi:hypothetical protein